MSAINEMLRDLDARGASQPHPPMDRERLITRDVSISQPNAKKKLLWVGLVGLGLTLAAGISVTRQAPGPHTEKAIPVSLQKLGEAPLSVAASQESKSAAADSTTTVPDSVVPFFRVDEALNRIPIADIHKVTPSVLPQAVNHVVASAGKPSLPPSQRAAKDEPRATPSPQRTNVAIEASPETAAQQLYSEANALRREGKPDAARRKYREALERNPALVEARLQLAASMREEGDTGAATTLLESGYAKQHDEALAAAIGRMYAETGQRSEALAWLARGSGELQPADQALMGALLSQEHRYHEAVNAYQTALKTEPHKGGWLLGLGLALENSDRREDAQSAFRQALEWGDFKPEVVDFLKKRIGTPLE